ncbi:hypothetical protein [Streptomyces sp. NPDC018711]|uniref:hypothetical protein n=1 Tax=Streptomyces sp. NPDC018711 TaxID=3365052 RepID=UPI0037AFA93D
MAVSLMAFWACRALAVVLVPRLHTLQVGGALGEFGLQDAGPVRWLQYVLAAFALRRLLVGLPELEGFRVDPPPGERPPWGAALPGGVCPAGT